MCDIYGGDSGIYLSEDPDYPLSCVKDFHITSGIVVQEEPVIRASAPFKASRSNQVVECSFSVIRAFATVGESFAFAVSEPMQFNALCGISFFDPDDTALGSLANCEVKSTTQLMGVSVVSSYTIRGIID